MTWVVRCCVWLLDVKKAVVVGALFAPELGLHAIAVAVAIAIAIAIPVVTATARWWPFASEHC